MYQQIYLNIYDYILDYLTYVPPIHNILFDFKHTYLNNLNQLLKSISAL